MHVNLILDQEIQSLKQMNLNYVSDLNVLKSSHIEIEKEMKALKRKNHLYKEEIINLTNENNKQSQTIITEDCKRKRSKAASRVNKFMNALKIKSDTMEINEKIGHVKNAIELLGTLQDVLLSYADNIDNANLQVEELAGISKKESFKDEEEVQFEKRIKLDNDVKDNRFQVELPWKYNPDTFKNNRNQAVERDIRLLRQLSKRSEVLVLFQEQIKEMVATGVLRKVDSAYPKRYLPLLAISSLGRESSKVRICLDAKCKFEGISLNDYLFNGRIEINDIFKVLN